MTQNKVSRCEQLLVRGLRYNIRHWGNEGAPKVFMLHGWMDSSATFEFVVQAMKEEWHVIAPDWRGYGLSEWLSRPYWFPDYYADLEKLLDHYSPEAPVFLVGHSMGANIASTYAGTRPKRVSGLAMLDFLGLPATNGEDAASHLAKWLDGIQNEPKLRIYPSHVALARRLRFFNPRLTGERADFLSLHVSKTRSDGQVEMACDPWHKIPAPNLYRIENSMVYWRAIDVPVLMLIADQGFVQNRFGIDSIEYQERLSCFAKLDVEIVKGSSHNLQHDQPDAVAAALELFLCSVKARLNNG